MRAGLADIAAIGSLLGGLALAYLVVGLALDVLHTWRRRSTRRASAELTTLLFADEEEAAAAAERLAGFGPRVLLPLVQRLAADLDGDADARLRRLVRSSGLAHRIRRLTRSRRRRRRMQAAALAPLLPEGDPKRTALLDDPHPLVRSRAAAHLETTDVVREAPALLGMLDDTSPSVRFAAQQALLRGDGLLIEALATYLAATETVGTGLALEVAATMPDPRLQAAIVAYTESKDTTLRTRATAALAPDAGGVALLRRQLTDPEPDVRAAAARAAGTDGGELLCPDLGAALGDSAWTVRLAAGRSLAALGPVGALTLRRNLFVRDAYARDMARRTLDDIVAQEGRPVAPAPVPDALDPWPDAAEAS